VAQPSPEEPARLRWWLASDSPTRASARSWACWSNDTALGLSSCKEAPFVSSDLAIESGAPAELGFSLPEAALPDQPWVAWLVACAGSELTPSAEALTDPSAAFRHPERSYRCSDGARPLLAAYRSRVSVPPNHNPDLNAIGLTLDGQPWSEPTALAPGGACQDTDVRVAAGSSLLIEGVLPSELRERYAEPTQLDLGREGLFLTHLATMPGLERAYTYVSASSDEATLSLELNLPDSVEGDRPVQEAFYLIARDERGGVDVLQRSLCIEPSSSATVPQPEETQ